MSGFCSERDPATAGELWRPVRVAPDPPEWFRGQLRPWRVKRMVDGNWVSYRAGERVSYYATEDAAAEVALRLNCAECPNRKAVPEGEL